MKHLKIGSLLIQTCAFLLFMSFTAPIVWGAADVYLIYSGKNKADKKLFKKAFPKGIKVKAYNADLLAVADYSGKQKAAAKFDRARVIVILRDRPMEMLKGVALNKDLIIIESVLSSVSSSRKTHYILRTGTDVSALESDFKKKTVTTLDDLSEGTLFLVDERVLKIQEVLPKLVEKIMQP